MRILVTGGAGFIGSHLVDTLIDHDHIVTVVDDLSTGNLSNLNKRVDFENFKISDCPSLTSILKSSDMVFHLAGRGSVPKSIVNPKLTYEINFLETFHLLEQIRTHPIPFIFASSSSVYGINSEIPRSIDQKIHPISPYAGSKAAAEMLLLGHIEAYNLPINIVRFFNVYGPRQESKSDYAAVVPNFINNILTNKDLIIHGDGNQSRDFTFVFDLVKLLFSLVEKGILNKPVANFAFGNSFTINEIADTLLNISGSNVSKIYNQSRKGDILFSQSKPDFEVTSRTSNIFTDLKTGLNLTYNSYL